MMTSFGSANVTTTNAAVRSAPDALALINRWCSETKAKADALAPDDDWGDSIGDTIAADVMRRHAAEVRALIEGES